MLFTLSIILCIFSRTCDAKYEAYKEHRVYNIKFTTRQQQDELHKLKIDSADFWRNPSFDNGVDGRVMIPPTQFKIFEGIIEELGVEKNIEIEDLFEYLNEKDKQLPRTLSRASEEFGFDRYFRYAEILEHLNLIYEYSKNVTDYVEIITYGKTMEERSLVYLKISNNNGTTKPVAIIEAGINPREWITIPAAVNIAEKLLDEQELLDKFDWIVIPVLNPDGYEYTHTNLRLWTKSMSQNSNLGMICPGVNLNRNFDIDWLVSDSSSSPCSHLYGGIEPFSEVETQLTKNLLEEYGNRVTFYISLRNKNGFVTYPWQFEQAASGMFRQHYYLGLEMINNSKYNYTLDVASIAVGERISGTSTDYARQNGVLYPFNIEIIGRGDDFVFIPEEEIKDIVDDVWMMVSAAAKKI